MEAVKRIFIIFNNVAKDVYDSLVLLDAEKKSSNIQWALDIAKGMVRNVHMWKVKFILVTSSYCYSQQASNSPRFGC